jgi:hypothetical protein
VLTEDAIVEAGKTLARAALRTPCLLSARRDIADAVAGFRAHQAGGSGISR